MRNIDKRIIMLFSIFTTSGKSDYSPAAVLSFCALLLLLSAACGEAEENQTLTTGIGMNVLRGNSDKASANAYMTWEHEYEKNLLRIDAEASYGEATVEEDGSSRTEKLTDTGELGLNYKRKLNGAYCYTDGSLFYDKIAEVDYRTRIVSGAGFYPVKNDLITANFDVGGGYLWEESGDEPEEYPLFRVSERYEQKIGKSSKIWQSFEYLLKAEYLARFIINAEIGAEAPMNSALSLRITLKDRYNSDPAEDREKNDLTLSASIAWKH